VALIRGTREKMFFREIMKLADCYSPTKTIWSRRDWDGCCAKPRSMMASELWPFDENSRRASRLVLRTRVRLASDNAKQVLLANPSSAKTKLFESKL